ncbi:ATP synthase F0 subunit C [Actinokineospora pegani]|uniref:ATP synthase F0 subunit C n=1 Tax=Actinokineospora pegani TaxID=2654637 RepID=UPI0018D4D193|nr:ATP synthase F0 subunit C [Actinokineospora pegani]
MSALVLAQTPVEGLEALASGLAAIGYGLGVIGSAIGVALIWSAVINGTARQPEAQSKLMGIAWTTFVLVEVLALIGLVVFFLV